MCGRTAAAATTGKNNNDNASETQRRKRDGECVKLACSCTDLITLLIQSGTDTVSDADADADADDDADAHFAAYKCRAAVRGAQTSFRRCPQAGMSERDREAGSGKQASRGFITLIHKYQRLGPVGTLIKRQAQQAQITSIARDEKAGKKKWDNI